MQFLRRLLNIYISSWWLSAFIGGCVFAAISLCVLWVTGCVPLPWITPVQWIDSLIPAMFLPLLALFVISIMGILVAAIDQLRKHQSKGRITLTLFFVSLLGAIFGLWGFVAILFGPILCSDTPRNHAYAMKSALELANLAPLPESATNITTQLKGSGFDWMVVVVFEAPETELKQWLAVSPGIKNLAPNPLADGSLEYSMEGSGTAATVIWSAHKRKIEIRVAQWL